MKADLASAGTTRSRITRMLFIACMAAMLGACGEESPEASRPAADATRAPQESAPPSTAASTPPLPGQCVAAAPPPRASAPRLDTDACKVVVRHTQDRVILKAKFDPTRLSHWVEFHGYFHTPISVLPGKAGYWSWVADFPKGADESHYLLIMDDVYGDIPGCFSNGGDDAEFTATVNRQDGTFKAFIPRLCISEKGARVAPVWIRASVNLTPNNGYNDYDFRRAYFTKRLYPGDVAIQRR